MSTETIRHAETAPENAHWYNTPAESFIGAVSGDELARARAASMSEFEAPETDPAEADPDEARLSPESEAAFRAAYRGGVAYEAPSSNFCPIHGAGCEAWS